MRVRAFPSSLLLLAGFALAACDASEPVGPSASAVASASSAPAALSAASASASDGGYIVVLSETARAQSRAAQVDLPAVVAKARSFRGAQVRAQFENALVGFAAEMTADQAAELAADPRVAYVEPDGPVYAVGSGSQSNATWGLDRSDDRSGRDGTYTWNADGTGVTAYVIDTGIRTSHVDFGGRATNGFDAFGGDGQDCNGHGTHVAGTVGGATYGIAKNVDLVGVRVLDCNGSGSYSGVIAGIDWVVANASGPSVANMSLGGGASSSVDAAVNNAVASGVVMAVAAGNDNRNACNYSPARAADALTVGSTTSSDARSSFSNYGSCVDLFAPGSSITSAWYTSNTATVTISGTSMASPHVAGAAALYLDLNPGASSTEVSDAVNAAATPGVVTNASSANDRLLYTLFDGGSTPDPDPEPEPEPTTFTLDAFGGTSRGSATVTLNWSGATSSSVDVYVNGSNGAMTANDGSEGYTLGRKRDVKGTYTFTVCEAGTQTCSNTARVTY